MAAPDLYAQTNRQLAQGYRVLVKTHPDRGVLVDRGFLNDVQEALRVIATVGAGPVTRGRCTTLAGILGELLGAAS